MEVDKYAKANTVASDYINAYFTQLSRPSTRGNLTALYRDHSTTLWSEMYETGVRQIMNFYQGLPYQKMDFTMKDCKVCPAGSGDQGVMVLVIGDMDLDGAVQESVYEVFYLERDEAGWFIGSQILGFLNEPNGDFGGGLTPS